MALILACDCFKWHLAHCRGHDNDMFTTGRRDTMTMQVGSRPVVNLSPRKEETWLALKLAVLVYKSHTEEWGNKVVHVVEEHSFSYGCKSSGYSKRIQFKTFLNILQSLSTSLPTTNPPTSLLLFQQVWTENFILVTSYINLLLTHQVTSTTSSFWWHVLTEAVRITRFGCCRLRAT